MKLFIVRSTIPNNRVRWFKSMNTWVYSDYPPHDCTLFRDVQAAEEMAGYLQTCCGIEGEHVEAIEV